MSNNLKKKLNEVMSAIDKNKLMKAKKTVEEFTEGKYEYVIATHIDKTCIHNHIIFNSVVTHHFINLGFIICLGIIYAN